MAVNNLNNISLGLGDVEFGTYVNSVFQAYSDVGAIKSEVGVEWNREVLDFETGRPLLTIKQEVIRENVTVSVTLAELTVANLKQSLGQGSIGSGSIPTFLDASSTAPVGTGLTSGTTSVISGEIFKFGGLPTHSYIGFRFTHRKESGKRIIFEGYRASPMGPITLPFRETDWNLRECKFRLLADTNKAAGEQYCQLHIEQ